jgi:hypothetical protein
MGKGQLSNAEIKKTADATLKVAQAIAKSIRGGKK